VQAQELIQALEQAQERLRVLAQEQVLVLGLAVAQVQEWDQARAQVLGWDLQQERARESVQDLVQVQERVLVDQELPQVQV
jgi:hypothetical protein